MPEICRKPIPDGTDIGLYEGDTRLAGLVVFDLPLRVGDRAVRCGCIGGVGTAREHRGNGYARLVLDDALAHIRESGMAISALFGIPGFYPKWGFAPVLVEATLEMETAIALQSPAALPVRAMQPQDVAAVAQIYACENAQRTGTIVRTSGAWPGFRIGVNWNDNVAAYVAEDAGQVVGYAAYNSEPWENQVAEISGSHAAMAALLHELGERAQIKHREKIAFHLPPDHAFVSYCTGLGCKLIIEYPHAGSGMARVIDQSGLLRTLTPLFRQRLSASACQSWRGTLVLATQLGEDAVELGGTQQYPVRLPQERLIQLVLGYRSATEMALDGHIDCASELVPVLDAVFPRGNPYMWHPDRF